MLSVCVCVCVSECVSGSVKLCVSLVYRCSPVSFTVCQGDKGKLLFTFKALLKRCLVHRLACWEEITVLPLSDIAFSSKM